MVGIRCEFREVGASTLLIHNFKMRPLFLGAVCISCGVVWAKEEGPLPYTLTTPSDKMYVDGMNPNMRFHLDSHEDQYWNITAYVKRDITVQAHNVTLKVDSIQRDCDRAYWSRNTYRLHTPDGRPMMGIRPSMKIDIVTGVDGLVHTIVLELPREPMKMTFYFAERPMYHLATVPGGFQFTPSHVTPQGACTLTVDCPGNPPFNGVYYGKDQQHKKNPSPSLQCKQSDASQPPSRYPTYQRPSQSPSDEPGQIPRETPTFERPSQTPSQIPSQTPGVEPSATPSIQGPSRSPSAIPSMECNSGPIQHTACACPRK